jgi:uncharacterized protein YciI
MYALAILRYRKPLEDVLKHVEAHRAYLHQLRARGVLVASGPFEPRYGGGLLLRVGDDGAAATLDAIRDADPFVTEGVAQYEILPWRVVIGVEALDSLP